MFKLNNTKRKLPWINKEKRGGGERKNFRKRNCIQTTCLSSNITKKYAVVYKEKQVHNVDILKISFMIKT